MLRTGSLKSYLQSLRPSLKSALFIPLYSRPQFKYIHSEKTSVKNNSKSSKHVSRPTFVSHHFRLVDHDIEEFLEKYSLSHYIQHGHLHIRCPVCSTGRRSLQVTRETGSYQCSTCSTSGTWFDLKRLFAQELRGVKASSNMETLTLFNESKDQDLKRGIERFGIKRYDLTQSTVNLLKNKKVLDWFHARSLSTETLAKNNVGMFDKSQSWCQQWLPKISSSFPNYDGPFIVYPQFASFTKASDASAFQVGTLEDTPRYFTSSAFGNASLFGLNSLPMANRSKELVKQAESTLVLVDSPLDMLAVDEHLQLPSVVRPNAGKVYKLPLEVLPLLEDFETIYIWMNDDVHGYEASQSFSRKLGLERCKIVNTRGRDVEGPLGAFEALQVWGKQGLERILKKAVPYHHEALATFGDVRTAIHREFVNHQQVQGVQAKGFQGLDKILKGHRRGELTIVTGPTGVGKTTILSQLSLDYCQAGVITLWGSFEITNTRLGKKMLCQLAEQDFSKQPENFDFWADKFEDLPMYFLRYQGSTPLSEVMTALEQAVYTLDVQHVILDNLQFMMSGQGHRMDKFDIQEEAIHSLRHFSSKYNVHVTLVVHPRKESEGAPLEIYSVFGSGKVIQEADNVVIIQDSEQGRYLEVKKNRFDGCLGKSWYQFDTSSFKIQEIPPPGSLEKDKGSSQEESQVKRAFQKKTRQTS